MRSRDDDGYTLAELIITTTLMGVVTAVTTLAIVQIYRSFHSVDTEVEAQTQVTAAFRTLDQEIRYARSISDPASIDGDHYVEYLVDLGDVDTCVQLRLRPSTGELQRREQGVVRCRLRGLARVRGLAREGGAIVCAALRTTGPWRPG